MADRIYAIGDIHGQIGMLEDALARIDADGGADAEIVFLGDYVDRGPDACAVLQTLIDGRAAGRNWTILKGNHDRMFWRFLDSGQIHDDGIKTPGLDWLHPRLGGVETLASYGVRSAGRSVDEILTDAREAVPQAHREFIANLDLVAERGEHLFVHAGLRPGVALADQVEDDLIWIREPFLSYSKPFQWLVVHGHTALERPEHYGNRIDLDGGAGYGRPLYPAVFEAGAVWLLDSDGRVPLLPSGD